CDHAIPRGSQAQYSVAERCAHPLRHHALAELAAAALEQRSLRAADLRAAGQADPEIRPARSRDGGKKHGELQPRGARARCASVAAAVPYRERAHARRLLGGGTAVPDPESRTATRPLCAGTGMVRPRIVVAVVARDGTGASSCNGVTRSNRHKHTGVII